MDGEKRETDLPAVPTTRKGWSAVALDPEHEKVLAKASDEELCIAVLDVCSRLGKGKPKHVFVSNGGRARKLSRKEVRGLCVQGKKALK